MDPRSFSATRWLFAMIGQWVATRYPDRFPTKSVGAGILVGVLTFIAVMSDNFSPPMWGELILALS